MWWSDTHEIHEQGPRQQYHGASLPAIMTPTAEHTHCCYYEMGMMLAAIAKAMNPSRWADHVRCPLVPALPACVASALASCLYVPGSVCAVPARTH